MMTLKLSRTAIRELTARYRAVLRNAALVAAGIVFTAGAANAVSTAVTGLSNYNSGTGYEISTGAFATADDLTALNTTVGSNTTAIGAETARATQAEGALDERLTTAEGKITNQGEAITTNTNNIAHNAADITKITNGTTVVGKATADANGNNIINTYATKAELSDYAKASDLDDKQDTISDLETIRSNASAGKAAGDTIAGYGDVVSHDASEFATATQGALADSALQSGDNISELTNDAGYITSSYHDSTKQDTISDLETIRSNASAGKDASETIAGYGDVVSHNASEFATASALASETQRATDAEDALRTSVNVLRNAAINADIALDNKIDDVDEKIGTAVDGNYIAAENDVSTNLSALDTQVEQNATDIATNASDIADIKDGFDFTGSISTTGDASVGGALGVTGKSTLGELSAGATTLASLAIGETGKGFDASGNVTAGTLKAGASTLVSLAIEGTGKGFDASGNVAANEATVNSLKIGSTTNGFDGDGNLKAKAIVADGDYTSTNGNITLTNGDLNLTSGRANLSGGINVNDKFTVDTDGNAKVVSLDAGSGEIKTTGAVKAGTLETTGNATIGGELVASGDLKVKNSENTMFKVESATGNTTVGGTLKVGAANAISGTENVLHMGNNSLTDIANLAMAGNATIGGTLDVTGKTTLGELSAGATTLASLAFADGNVVNAIDNGTVAQNSESENKDATLATVATVLKSAENATYTVSGRPEANVTTNTLHDAIDQLDQTIGDRNIESANSAINTALSGEGTVAKAIEQIGNEIGSQQYVADNAVAYGAFAEGTDLTSAISQLSSNVGEFAEEYTSNGNIETTNTVNANLALLDTNIGNLSSLVNENGNLGEGQPASIVAALNGLDATFGKVHGLVTLNDGVKQFNGTAVSTNIEGDEYKGNLAVGTTVEDHLVSLDNAIGVRDIHSVNTALNTVAREQSLSKAMELTGNLIGDMDLQGKYISGTTNLTDAVKKLDSNLARVEDHIEHVKDNAERGIAAISALTALVPNARDDGSTQLSFGSGNYNDKFGFALGGFHYFNDHVLMNAGASWGGDKNVAFRAGVTVGLGF